MIGVLLSLAIIGLALATLAATASVTLNEIGWHDLEEYCKRKNQPELFGRIFDLREQLTLGANILQMIATAIGTVTMTGWLLEGRAISELSRNEFLSITTLIALCLVVTGSWIPWAWSRIGAVGFLFRTWRWWWVVSALATPLLMVGELLSRLFQRASGQDETEEDEEEAFEDEILSMVSEGQHDGFLESDARDMIEGVMELDDRDVGMVMTPRSRIDAMDISSEPDEVMRRVVESGRTRIPVYDQKLDNVLGILYAKDLLRESMRHESKRRSLKKLIREPLFVPETKLLDDMLKVFLKGRSHMAIVEDEYGGVAGVVTIEDVLEEIVGEIEDETDNERDEEIVILQPGSAEVAGAVGIHRLNETFGLRLPEDEDFDTLSGFLMQQLNEVPREGRELSFDQANFRVLIADRRHVKKVRLDIREEPA